jgi:GNAT superfamily N-acetyltransferase
MNDRLAWKLFIDGFSTSSASMTLERRRVGPIDVLHFRRRAPADAFDEFLVRDCDPADALAIVAATEPVQEHYITVLADQHYRRAEYEQAGYELTHSEALMVRDMRLPLPLDSGVEVIVARTASDMEWLNANDPEKRAWITPQHLAHPRLLLYAALVEGLPAARGRNLQLDAAHGYVSRIYTGEAFRRRGMARALMLRLLRDEAARGAQWSILTASAMGAGLYAGLGYETLATIHIFEPARREG